MKLTERQATTSDTQWLWSLYVDLLKPSISSQWGWDQGYQEEMFATHLPAEEFKIVSVEDTRAAAYLVNREVDHDYVKMLLVAGEYQRRGIGKSIIDQLKVKANNEAVPLRLSVIKTNPVLGFYEKQGFVISSVEKDSTRLIYTSFKHVHNNQSILR